MKARSYGLKAACTRKNNELSEFLRYENLNETALEEQRLIPKQTLRTLFDSMSNAIIKLSDSAFENELNEQDKKVIEVKTKANALAELLVEIYNLVEKKNF